MQKLTLALVAGCLVSALGCDDGPAERIDNRTDCNDICDRFAECYTDEDYDVESCVDECEDNALNDDFEESVDACENCLDNEDSCVEDTAVCADECGGVVAQSA